MQTIILMWNPAISRYTMEMFEEELYELHGGTFYNYFWSITDYQQAHKGDRFFMVRYGEGKTGIVMSGSLCSEPYPAPDWARKGRTVYYIDLQPDYYVHTDKIDKYFATSYLNREFPGFDWNGGPAGRILPPELADKLSAQWDRYTRILHEQKKLDGTRASYWDWVHCPE